MTRFITRALSPLPKESLETVGEALQPVLTDLIDLGLLAKQAHWNLVGPGFVSLHHLLDDVADTARDHSDALAERMATVGAAPDGRAATIANESRLSKLAEGPLGEHLVVEAFIGALGIVAAGLRGAIAVTAEPDPVTQDLLIAATAAVEKHAWMFEVQRASGL